MLNRVKSAFGGRKLILSLPLSFFFLVFLTQVAFAQTTPTPTLPPTGGATTAAAKVEYTLPYPGILPDHVLYPLKMLRDKILDFFIREPVRKSEFSILMADKRLGAGKILVDTGKIELGLTTLSKGEKYLEKAVDQATLVRQQGKPMGDLLDKLERASQKHLEVLEEVRQKVPEVAKPTLEKVIETTQKGLEKVLELKKRA